MQYNLTCAVWELTMKCNMRCQHCGSSCEDALPDELTTEEAFQLCDELKELGLKYITLSGGEPTTRKDWDLIAERLTQQGIVTSMITNGWNLNHQMIERAKEVGINTIAISVDGCKEVHDRIRKPGSFNKVITNLKRIKEQNIVPAVITTVQIQNIGELEELYEILKSIGVMTWQLQIALPMGNFKKHKEECLQPEAVQQIIDFAYSRIDEEMNIDLADCIGYYTKKDMQLRKKRFKETTFWKGCSAGKYSVGILCNGDIVGCTSIRAKEFIEGNIRKTKLSDIWRGKESFSWNRNLTKKDLNGNCRKCQYADYCLGGCSNLKYCMNGNIYSENKYCVYSMEIDDYIERIDGLNQKGELEELMYFMLRNEQYQVAGIALERLKKLFDGDEALKEVEAFICFKLGDYETSKAINMELLARNPKNKHVKKGLGLAIYQLGEEDKGIQLLYEALDSSYIDSYYDLYSLLKEKNYVNEAQNILDMIQVIKVHNEGINI